MSTDAVMEITNDALFTTMMLASPVLIISVLVGLVIAVFQAATQVHEQTLTFVPKLIAIALILLFLGPWMIELMNDFTVRLFNDMIQYA